MIDRDRLLATFLSLLQISSETGAEADIVREVLFRLTSLGLRPRTDAAGNIIAVSPGDGGPYLVNAHVDTVMSTRGLKVILQNDVVQTDGLTILGADDKAGVAAILEVVQCLVEGALPHTGLELVLTVGEEQGLLGAKVLDFGHLSSREGVCVDSSGPVGTIVTKAPSQAFIDVRVTGRAAHAGLAPEQGISAVVAASEAIARMRLGRIDEETTANVGTIVGGTSRNIVPERVGLKAEARSRDEAKLRDQIEHMRTAFEEAAARHRATAVVDVSEAYRGFDISPDEPIVHRVVVAAKSVGITPRLQATGGGSDANVFNQHGIKTVNLGAGYENAHAPTERIAIDELVRCATLLLAVFTLR
ncbi:MAG: M20/M25/M40 family metallo-hydrolase [Chloroflexi bacterium]|nr:M20/M25/M40 family metallo-hydrolase [Chloroflexota bacterium]